MAGTTPNLGLYLPGGGSTGTYTPDEVADIDPLNQNFTKIDTFSGAVGDQTKQNKQFYGPAAGIATVTGHKLGDEYRESDGDKRKWLYDGSNWIASEGGAWLIRPTTVAGTGVTIVDGKVSFGTTGDNLTVNGVFSARFKRYLVIAEWQNVPGGVNGAFLQFTTAGVPFAAANYTQQSVLAFSTTVQGVSALSQVQASLVHIAALDHFFEATIINPFQSAFTKMLLHSGNQNSAVGLSHSSSLVNVVTAFDGFKITLSTTGGGRLFSGGELAVYGLV